MRLMEEEYREHAGMVYRYLLSLTRDTALAEELTQETFYQAIRCVERFNGQCKVSTWLCAIAKNLLLVYRRKHPVTAELDDTFAAADAPQEEVLAKLQQVELMRRMHALEGDTREVLYLRLLGELTFRQIGEILGKSENWARVTYYRGKEKLKRGLKEDE